MKGHSRFDSDVREKHVYSRLLDRKVFSLGPLQVPRLQDYSDDLLILEISIVEPPYLLDFGGAYLGQPPDHAVFDEEWETEKQEQFGEDFLRMKSVLREFYAKMGVFIEDKVLF